LNALKRSPGLRLLLLLPVWLILVAGCSTVSYDTLKQKAFEQGDSRHPATVYYCGTKAGCDYFYIEHADTDGARSGHEYRVRSKDSQVPNQFPYTRERTQWLKASLYTTSIFGR
jgi:hypothetical protein